MAAERLAAIVGIDRSALLDVYEPALLREGLVAVTPRGRVATVSRA